MNFTGYPDGAHSYFEKSSIPSAIGSSNGLPAKIGIFMLPHSVRGPEAGKTYRLKAVAFLLVLLNTKYAQGACNAMYV